MYKKGSRDEIRLMLPEIINHQVRETPLTYSLLTVNTERGAMVSRGNFVVI